MEGRELKEYIRRVYLLEASLYQQNDLLYEVENQRDYYVNYRGQQINEIPLEDVSINDEVGCCSLFGVVLGGGIAFVVSLFKANSGESFLYIMITGIILGFLLPLVFLLVLQSWNEKEAEERYKEKVRQNELLKSQNKKNAIIKADLLKNEISDLEDQYYETKDILDEYYEKNIIFPKYRNIVAISSLYEYLESGRCSRLDGHEGAYNIYENELRQEIIIRKLDDVIQRLDMIADNQIMLYNAITECNKNNVNILNAIMFIAKVKCRKLQTAFVGDCRSNGWGECRS